MSCKQEEEDIIHLFLDCIELKSISAFIREILIDLKASEGFSTQEFRQWLLFAHNTSDYIYTDFIKLLLSLYRLCVYKRKLLVSKGRSKLDPVALYKSMCFNHFKYLYFQYRFYKKEHVFIRKYIMTNSILNFTLPNQLSYSWPQV